MKSPRRISQKANSIFCFIVSIHLITGLGRNSVCAQELLYTLLPITQNFQLEVQEGYSVATGQQYHVVGKPYTDIGPHTDAGAVEVYDAQTHAHIATIENPEPSDGDLFGVSVSVSGNTLVVGAMRGDVGGYNAGAAYVYDLNAGNPKFQRSLINPNPYRDGYFGASVAIDRDLVVVGAYRGRYDGFYDAGSAYVYNLGDHSTSIAAPLLTLNNPEPEDYDDFGYSVSISGNIVVVGTKGDNAGETSAGSAYVYDVSSDPADAPIAVLRNPTPDRYDRFGNAVAVSGEIVVVGAYTDSTAGFEDGVAYVFDLDSADVETPIFALLNPTPEGGDYFGWSVAISGEMVVVGALLDNTGAIQTGSAYIYDLLAIDPETPTLTLNNPSPNYGDSFGYSVSIWGNTVIVGVPFDDTNAVDAGESFIFNLDGEIPDSPVATLGHPSPATNDDFGYSVAVSDNVVVVGTPMDDTGAEDAGIAYVYDTHSAEPDIPIALLSNPSPAKNDAFGRCVSVSSNIIVVGAPFDDKGETNTNYGYVYVFDMNSENPEIPILTLGSPSPVVGELFGISVSASGSIIVAGANGESTGADDAGAAYVFDLSSKNPETPIFTLLNPMPEDGDKFGDSVAVSGNIIVVGAPRDDLGARDSGSAFVFDLESANPETPIVTLLNPTPADQELFGYSVAVSGNTVVVGSLWDRLGNIRVGAAYVYDLASPDPSTPTLKIENPTPTNDDGFGCSVSTSGDRILVGARSDVTFGVNTGLAYIYDLSHGNSVALYEIIQNPTPDNSDSFGRSTAISEECIVVGATGDSTRARHSGAAYVFEITDKSKIVPDSFLGIRGIHGGGQLEDLFLSDDQYLSFKPEVILGSNEPPVWIEYRGTSPILEPSQLTLILEARSSTYGLQQVVEVFDFLTGEFETVDVHLSQTSDLTIEIELAGELSRFVDAATGMLRVRTSWRPIGPIRLSPWQVDIDRVNWVVKFP